MCRPVIYLATCTKLRERCKRRSKSKAGGLWIKCMGRKLKIFCSGENRPDPNSRKQSNAVELLGTIGNRFHRRKAVAGQNAGLKIGPSRQFKAVCELNLVGFSADAVP